MTSYEIEPPRAGAGTYATTHRVDHTRFHNLLGYAANAASGSDIDVSWGRREPDCWDRLD
jgi:hypothetical protein